MAKQHFSLYRTLILLYGGCKMPIGLPEFVENPEPRCPVILLCDTSSLMHGKPINALNRGLAV